MPTGFSSLNYVDFLREIGVHFSVNKMLTAECVKTRMEKGITFLEFNYMLMQSYDFLHLAREYGCKMQFGGNDQWSNIIGGVELNRRCDRPRCVRHDVHAFDNAAKAKKWVRPKKEQSGWTPKRQARTSSSSTGATSDDCRGAKLPEASHRCARQGDRRD